MEDTTLTQPERLSSEFDEDSVVPKMMKFQLGAHNVRCWSAHREVLSQGIQHRMLP